MFSVTTLDLNNIPRRDGRVDFSEDFFGKEATLTVSDGMLVTPVTSIKNRSKPSPKPL